ncbi:hypothetical protein CL645_02460 [bacterium]|nr:hypothetical protein [bacterium]|tara:strand:- start:2207 stop:2854 length:648 start_codon:yes stop_codon:yes gene_type:complete
MNELNSFSILSWNLTAAWMVLQAYRMGFKLIEYIAAIGVLSVILVGWGMSTSAERPEVMLFGILVSTLLGTVALLLIMNYGESKSSGFGAIHMTGIRHSRSVNATYKKNLYIKKSFQAWVKNKPNPFMDMPQHGRDNEFEKSWTEGDVEGCRFRLNEIGIEGYEAENEIYKCWIRYASEIAEFDKAVMKGYKGRKVYGIEDDPAGTKIDHWQKRD